MIPTPATEEWVQQYVLRLLSSRPASVALFPVGAVYINVSGTDPATELGYGTWAAIGAGRALVGYAAGDPDFGTLEGTAGATSVSHGHTYTDVPNHTHADSAINSLHSHTVPVSTGTPATASGGSNALQGVDRSIDTNKATSSDATAVSLALGNPVGGVATGNTATSAVKVVQPSFVVCFWKRTA